MCNSTYNYCKWCFSGRSGSNWSKCTITNKITLFSAWTLSLASSTASLLAVSPLSLRDVLLTDWVLVLLCDLLTFRFASACFLISCSVRNSKMRSFISGSSQISIHINVKNLIMTIPKTKQPKIYLQESRRVYFSRLDPPRLEQAVPKLPATKKKMPNLIKTWDKAQRSELHVPNRRPHGRAANRLCPWRPSSRCDPGGILPRWCSHWRRLCATVNR